MSPLNRSPHWRAALLAAAAWLLPATASATGSAPAPLTQTECSFEGMLDELRGALKTGSPAYRKYVKARLKLAARAMPADPLLAAVAQERDADTLGLGSVPAEPPEGISSIAVCSTWLARKLPWYRAVPFGLIRRPT